MNGKNGNPHPATPPHPAVPPAVRRSPQPPGRPVFAIIADIRRFSPYLWPHRWRFGVGMVCMTLGSCLGLCFPLLVGGLVDASLNPGGTVIPGFGQLTLDGVIWCLVGTVGFQAVAIVSSTRLFRRIGQVALADLRRDTYERVLLLPMAFFSRSRTGELVSRLSTDISQIEGALVTGLPQFFRQVVIATGAIAFIATTSPQLTLLLLLTLPFVIAAVSIFSRKLRRLSREMQDRIAACGVVVEETLQAITSVKAFANEAYEARRYSGANTAALNTGYRVAFWNAIFSGFTLFALFAGIIFVLWRGAHLLQEGRLTAGELTRFILYATYLAGAMGQVAELFAQIQRGIGATQRVQELLREKTEMMAHAPAVLAAKDLPAQLDGAVEFEHVCFHYPSRPEAPVLQDVSFVVPPGRVLALVGPSGAGKSTITSLLLRFYSPDGGSIRIGGRDIRDYPIDWLRGQMAIVPQDVVLFGGSIAENIAYGRPGAGRDEIREAARQANAHEFIEGFPEGYATTVGDRGTKLSGGQRQRIAIARAFLKNAPILILDEATSSLDSESERLIQRGLESLMQQRTTFVVAHRLATIRRADCIAVVEMGRIVEFGTHDDLVGRGDGLYRRIHDLQSGTGTALATGWNEPR